ncbi:TetR/AcrR family transcriptional regulator [Variovorax sp. WDL1]|nr:TetR/AcrR family transcriptional regulator [Variovorax sp. WDL1]
MRERRSRAEVVRDLREVFRRFGYEGATLTRIAEQTGLGRASLYHHFPNGKDEMLHAVFEQTEYAFDEQILSRLRGDLPPQERLRDVLEHLWEHYKGGSTTCFVALLALTCNEGELGPGIQRIFQKWVAAFAGVIEESGVGVEEAQLRAEDAVLRIQGALVLTRALNDPGPFERVMMMLSETLLARERSEPVSRAAAPRLLSKRSTVAHARQ